MEQYKRFEDKILSGWLLELKNCFRGSLSSVRCGSLPTGAIFEHSVATVKFPILWWILSHLWPLMSMDIHEKQCRWKVELGSGVTGHTKGAQPWRREIKRTPPMCIDTDATGWITGPEGDSDSKYGIRLSYQLLNPDTTSISWSPLDKCLMMMWCLSSED